MDELERGRHFYEARRYDHAGQCFLEVLSVSPDHPLAMAYLALCYCFLQKPREALLQAEEAVGLHPEAHFLHSVLAFILYRENRDQEALSTITRAIELEPEHPPYFGLAASLNLALNRPEVALALAELGLRIDSQERSCRLAHARALAQLGRGPEAEEGLRALLQDQPEDAAALAALGWAQLAAGQSSAALPHLREALRLDPHDEVARRGMLEALKAQSPAYHSYLRFFLNLHQSPEARIALALAYLLALLVELKLMQWGERQPLVWIAACPLMVLCMPFVGPWMVGVVTNLPLRLHPFGRYLLSDDERQESAVVGSMLVVSLAIGLLSGLWKPDLWGAALLEAALLVPLSALWKCPAGPPRRWMTLYTTALGLLGLAAWQMGHYPATKAASVLLRYLFLLGVVASLFVDSFITDVWRERTDGRLLQVLGWRPAGTALLAAWRRSFPFIFDLFQRATLSLHETSPSSLGLTGLVAGFLGVIFVLAVAELYLPPGSGRAAVALAWLTVTCFPRANWVVGRTLLLIHPLGWRALPLRDLLESALVLMLLSAIPLTPQHLGLVALFLVGPLVATWNMRDGWPQRIFAGLIIVLATMATGLWWQSKDLSPQDPLGGAQAALLLACLLGWLTFAIVPWVANLSRRP